MSELLKIFELQADERLRRRVQGAAVEYAHTISAEPQPDPVSETEIDEEGNEHTIVSAPPAEPRRTYALSILSQPTRVRQELVERVLADQETLSLATETPSGWNSDAIPDDHIRSLVQGCWNATAEVHA